jgi:predicted translin family RNA/ssDNA-binding protein
MGIDTSISDPQSTLSMKKELLDELWKEVRRAVDVLHAAYSENALLKQSLSRANTEIESLKSQIANLEKLLVSRETASTALYEERERNRLVDAARELISKIDHQLNLL